MRGNAIRLDGVYATVFRQFWRFFSIFTQFLRFVLSIQMVAHFARYLVHPSKDYSMHRYVIARGLIRIYSRTVCVLLRRSNLMGALLISWTTVLHYCRVQFPSWMVFANHWLLHWSQTSIIFGKDFLTEQKLGNLELWIICQLHIESNVSKICEDIFYW